MSEKAIDTKVGVIICATKELKSKEVDLTLPSENLKSF